MQISVNENIIEFRDGMTARQVLQAAGFSESHYLAVELGDGTLYHLEDSEVIKPSKGDKFIAVPAAKKGINR